VSVRVPIIGDGLSGKSTVAAHVAGLLAKLRKLEARPYVILTQPTVAYKPYHVDIRRTKTLAGMLHLIQQADAPLVVDDLSEFYALMIESWRNQVGTHRDRAGLAMKARLSPDDWSHINTKFRDVFRQCQRMTVDICEVYRRGPVLVPDADYGMVEADGVKARGQAEAGTGGDLCLILDGGLKSRHRDSGNRILRVLSDASGKLVGKDLLLPRLSSKTDRDRLDRELARFLGPSLRELIAWTDEEAAAWGRVSDPIDQWGEARESAAKAEAEMIGSKVAALFAIHGLAGQKGENIMRRASLLVKHFGVGELDQLGEVPSDRLRQGFAAIEAELRGKAA
jgi:hypothetical protein